MEARLKKLVSEFLVHLGIDFTDIEVERIDDKNFRINISSEEPSLLIGYHGENLQAMQNVLKCIVYKQIGVDYSIILDVDNYRKRQEENVVSIALQKATEIQANKGQVALPPMSPYFRRIVHMQLSKGDFTNITTESVGEGDYRQVVIKYKA